MNWCQPHWNQLREAVKVRGLDGFGAQNGQQAVAEIKNQLEGEPETFDPLLGSWSRINTRMLESPACRGRIMQCPMCILVEDGQPELVAGWINGCTDNALQYAIEQGLVKTQ